MSRLVKVFFIWLFRREDRLLKRITERNGTKPTQCRVTSEAQLDIVLRQSTDSSWVFLGIRIWWHKTIRRLNRVTVLLFSYFTCHFLGLSCPHTRWMPRAWMHPETKRAQSEWDRTCERVEYASTLTDMCACQKGACLLLHLSLLIMDKLEKSHLRANGNISSASKWSAYCSSRKTQTRKQSRKRCGKVYSGAFLSYHYTVTYTG